MDRFDAMRLYARLLHRTTRQVSPTPDGQLPPRVRAFVDWLAELFADAC